MNNQIEITGNILNTELATLVKGAQEANYVVPAESEFL